MLLSLGGGGGGGGSGLPMTRRSCGLRQVQGFQDLVPQHRAIALVLASAKYVAEGFLTAEDAQPNLSSMMSFDAKVYQLIRLSTP